MSLIDVIANAIWGGFESDPHCHADREMSVIDTGGTYETFSMQRIAEHVLGALDQANTLHTAKQVDALPIPSADSLNGTIIRCLGTPTFGDIYERNTDGTWGLLATPGSNQLDQQRVPSKDVHLPVFVLWVPEV